MDLQQGLGAEGNQERTTRSGKGNKVETVKTHTGKQTGKHLKGKQKGKQTGEHTGKHTGKQR